MPIGYIGILRDGRIEWTGSGKPPDGPVLVLPRDEPPATPENEERRQQLTALLDEIVARGGIDAERWERERAETDDFGPWEQVRR